MKRTLFAVLLLLVFSALSGCAGPDYPPLPDDPIAFKTGSFEDTEHDGALYATLEYGGRTYIGYGTANRRFSRDKAESCIGYIVMDANITSVPDPDNRNSRVYTLVGDPDRNFLMDYDKTAGPMNQPYFRRAVDTRGKDIAVPEFIDDPGYEYWR